MTRRQAATLALLAPLSAVGGCEWLRNMTQPDKKLAAATGAIPPKTTQELVAYLNRQEGALTTVKYPRVLIDVKAGKETFTLNDSNLICSKTRNFSLVGGKSAVPGDILYAGSNDTEFWVYNKFGDPRSKYIFCSHADFERGTAELPFPFDADWALQALGMSFYDPNRPYRVDTDPAAREHRLSYESTTPRGATVRRTVVFAADSIPAILAITRDTFVVFTSNVFALLGLRAMYFALASLMRLFHYLHYGLALILVFIGSKILFEDLVYSAFGYRLSTPLELGVVGLLLAGSVGLSLLRPKAA